MDEDQAAVVRRIFHLYVHKGIELIPIAELLNAGGLSRQLEMHGGSGDSTCCAA